MSDKELRKKYRRVIMGLNALREMDERDLRLDRAYGIFVGVLIVLGIVVLSGLFTFELYAAGLGLLAAIVAAIGGSGIYRRGVIFRRFYQVEDATGLVTVETRPTSWLYEESPERPALVYSAEPDEPSITFLYNWLNKFGIIDQREKLKVLAIAADESAVNVPLLCIPLYQLKLEDGKPSDRLLYEAQIIDAAWA